MNWMIAGSGIVHSERTPERLRNVAHPFHGLQTWVALPEAQGGTAPTFAHHPWDTLPVVRLPGLEMTFDAGTVFGVESAVRVLSGALYVAIDLQPGASLGIPRTSRTRPVSGQRRTVARWRTPAAQHIGDTR